MSTWTQLASQVLEGYKLSRGEAMHILSCPDDEILQLLDGAFHIRRHYFGKKVKLNMIINTKSGICPEDCGYCSQSSRSRAEVDTYRMMSQEQIVAGAEKAYSLGAGTYCIVASGRGPSQKEIETVTGAVKQIKQQYPMRICACLGLLKEEQAQQLKKAGVDRYNHNINTSEAHHSTITTTHTYEDRASTISHVKTSGLSPCSGVIVGMGESKEDIIDMAFSLCEFDADSIPVNFLHAIPGTKLEQAEPLQPLGLYAANSIFLGSYLTTPGQEITADHKMITDMGFEIEQAHEQTPV